MALCFNRYPLQEGRLSVRIEAYPPDKRKRDLDNLPKAPLDALTISGLWKDDSQIDELHIVRCSVVSAGFIRVVINQL